MELQAVIERIDLTGISGYRLQPPPMNDSDNAAGKPMLDVQLVFSQSESEDKIVGLVTASLTSTDVVMEVVHTMLCSGFNAVWEQMEDEQKRAFVGGVAMPAILPYIRERFQSLSVSLGVPQIILPPFYPDDLTETPPSPPPVKSVDSGMA